MTNSELCRYVRKRLKNGYPAGELRHKLLRQGYAEPVIADAFAPCRRWSDPTQGFGIQQPWAPAIFVCGGMARLGMAISGNWVPAQRSPAFVLSHSM